MYHIYTYVYICVYIRTSAIDGSCNGDASKFSHEINSGETFFVAHHVYQSPAVVHFSRSVLVGHFSSNSALPRLHFDYKKPPPQGVFFFDWLSNQKPEGKRCFL